MISWARVGQKVICIDDSPPKGLSPIGTPWNPDLHGLCKGEEYSIRKVQVDELSGNLTILLNEIERPIRLRRTREPGYNVARFRPLLSQEDDISMFKSLLKPTEVPA